MPFLSILETHTHWILHAMKAMLAIFPQVLKSSLLHSTSAWGSGELHGFLRSSDWWGRRSESHHRLNLTTCSMIRLLILVAPTECRNTHWRGAPLSCLIQNVFWEWPCQWSGCLGNQPNGCVLQNPTAAMDRERTEPMDRGLSCCYSTPQCGWTWHSDVLLTLWYQPLKLSMQTRNPFGTILFFYSGQ